MVDKTGFLCNVVLEIVSCANSFIGKNPTNTINIVSSINHKLFITLTELLKKEVTNKWILL